MERCNKIYTHPLFQKRLNEISTAEINRKFCLHNTEHALDVARIGYILILESNLDIPKELFYAAALLHDIGRYTGIPHNESGAETARLILPECDFTKEETSLICNAIKGHRTNSNSDVFSEILYEADKKSRMCFMCNAQEECYWENEKKNLDITI